MSSSVSEPSRIKVWVVGRYILGVKPESLPGRLRKISPKSFAAAFEGKSPACALRQTEFKKKIATLPFALSEPTAKALRSLGNEDSLAGQSAWVLETKEEKDYLKPKAKPLPALSRLYYWALERYILGAKPAALAGRLLHLEPKEFTALFEGETPEVKARQAEFIKKIHKVFPGSALDTFGHLQRLGKEDGCFARRMADILSEKYHFRSPIFFS